MSKQQNNSPPPPPVHDTPVLGIARSAFNDIARAIKGPPKPPSGQK